MTHWSATLAHHLEKAYTDFKKNADILRESFYVENFVASVQSLSDLNCFVRESQIILSSAKFELRGSASNSNVPDDIDELSEN